MTWQTFSEPCRDLVNSQSWHCHCPWQNHKIKFECTTTNLLLFTHTHHTHTTILRPSWILSGTTQEDKTNLDLLEQLETVSGSGVSCAICKSSPWSRHITMPASRHSVFTGRLPFLPPNQQRQSTIQWYQNHFCAQISNG